MDWAIATGNVYEYHPGNGSIGSAILTNLNGSGTKLEGKYVEVDNAAASNAYETDGTFEYLESDTHFDEVMVYYHATEFQKWLDSAVGFECLELDGSPGCDPAQATVHHNNFFASADQPSYIYFGDSITRCSDLYNNPTREGNVIAHEYIHLVSYEVVPGSFTGTGSQYQPDALGEAFSDYFAGSYAGSPQIGEYVLDGSGSLRDMDNSYTMSSWYSLFNECPGNNYHQASQIFSGALWEMRQQLGVSTTNVLIFESLYNLTMSYPLFEDAREAIIAADYAEFNGNNVSTIEQIFDNREIYEPYSYPNVIINGPTIVQAGQSGLSWEADISQGRSPFNYQGSWMAARWA